MIGLRLSFPVALYTSSREHESGLSQLACGLSLPSFVGATFWSPVQMTGLTLSSS